MAEEEIPDDVIEGADLLVEKTNSESSKENEVIDSRV
jgi:hypothetical protein